MPGRFSPATVNIVMKHNSETQQAYGNTPRRTHQETGMNQQTQCNTKPVFTNLNQTWMIAQTWMNLILQANFVIPCVP